MIAIFYIASLLEITAVELLYFREDENKYTTFLYSVISRAIRIDCGVKENKSATKKSTYEVVDNCGRRFARNEWGQRRPYRNINKLTNENKTMLCNVRKEFLLGCNVTWSWKSFGEFVIRDCYIRITKTGSQRVVQLTSARNKTTCFHKKKDLHTSQASRTRNFLFEFPIQLWWNLRIFYAFRPVSAQVTSNYSGLGWSGQYYTHFPTPKSLPFLY